MCSTREDGSLPQGTDTREMTLEGGGDWCQGSWGGIGSWFCVHVLELHCSKVVRLDSCAKGFMEKLAFEEGFKEARGGSHQVLLQAGREKCRRGSLWWLGGGVQLEQWKSQGRVLGFWEVRQNETMDIFKSQKAGSGRKRGLHVLRRGWMLLEWKEGK